MPILNVVSATDIARSTSSGQPNTGSPDQVSLSYMDMTAVWAMLRTVMRGTEHMRLAGKEYLPQFPSETDADYKGRLSRTVLTNFFEDAVRNAASLPFKKPVMLNDKAPDWMKDVWNDIDLEGHNGSEFARAVLEDGIIMGYTFIFVDYSRTAGMSNLAEEREANARPFWVHIKAEDMFGINVDRINGVNVVTHARWREDFIRRRGFVEDVVQRVRVVEPGYYWLYENQGGWQVIEEGEISVDQVPIVPLICGRELYGKFIVKPLFLDLCFKQVEHWQSASDQRNILSFARFPMLACAGAGTEENPTVSPIGPNKLLTTSDPTGKWYYVEPRGDAIAAGQKDLETLKDEMRILGLQPVVGHTGNVTATARALDEVRVNSAVQVLALNLEGALNEALELTARWKGEENTEAATYVNRDFGISLRDSREIDALLRARVAGELSRETFWAELKRRNILAIDFDGDEEAERIKEEQDEGITLPGGQLPPENAGLKAYTKEAAFLNKAGSASSDSNAGAPETLGTQGGP